MHYGYNFTPTIKETVKYTECQMKINHGLWFTTYTKLESTVFIRRKTIDFHKKNRTVKYLYHCFSPLNKRIEKNALESCLSLTGALSRWAISCEMCHLEFVTSKVKAQDWE